MRFSQKIGKTSVRENIQIESIKTRLENRIWNTILNDFFDRISNSSYGKESDRAQICLIIWKEFFDYTPFINENSKSILEEYQYEKNW